MNVASSEVALTVFPLKPRITNDEGLIIDVPGFARIINADGTISQQSVFLRIVGFQPYVYLELDQKINWDQDRVNLIINEMQSMFRDNSPSYGKLVYKERLQYYRPDKKVPMIEASFREIKHIFYLRKTIKDERIKKALGLTGDMYEEDIDSILKLLTICNMSHSQWFSCKARPIPQAEWISFGNSNHHEYRVTWNSMVAIDNEVSKDWNIDINIMSFDIEAFSAEENRIPCPYFVDETAYLNVCTFQKLGDPSTRRRHVMSILPSDPVSGAELHNCKNEVELVATMAKLVQHYQPDIITGYNITGFDFEYLHVRLQVHQGQPFWPTMGKLKGEDHSKLDEISWSSSGAGDIKTKQLNLTGRLVIDVYSNVLRNYKLPRYDLNTVGMKFLKKEKHPIKAKEQFKIYREYVNILNKVNGSSVAGLVSEQREELEKELIRCRKEYTRVVEYCIQDAELVIELFEKLNIWPNLRATSYICHVQISDILEKGETVKSTSMLYSLARKLGFVMTPVEKKEFDYEGGLVQDPVQGFHKYIICQDFSSMYPSIMQAENTDPTTLLPDDVDVYPVDKDGNEIEDENLNKEFDDLANKKAKAAHACTHDSDKSCDCRVLQDQFKANFINNYKQYKDIYLKAEKEADNYINQFKEQAKAQINAGMLTTIGDVTVISAPDPDKLKEGVELRKQIDDYDYNVNRLDFIDKYLLVNKGKVYSSRIASNKVNTNKVPSKDGNSVTVVHFVKKEVREGLAPMKVRELIAARKVYKKLMEPLTDPESGLYNGPPEKFLLYTLYDCFQNRLKIAANSLYGYFGAPFNKYACFPVAMSITCKGRELITFVSNYLKDKYNAKIIYGDTDSVMVDAGITDGKQCHIIGKKMAAEITALFPPPLAIAYEKSMNILCLLKKHYAAFLIDKDGNAVERPDKMMSKGIITARRDYNTWVQGIYKQVLLLILKSNKLKNVLTIVINGINDLLNDKVAIKDLVLIKKYTSNAGDKYFLKQFVDRKRREGRSYQVGERIEFVYLLKPGADKAHEKMESIEDFDPTTMKLDYKYYLEHQYKKPIDNLLSIAYRAELEAHVEAGVGYRPGNRRKKFIPINEPVKMMIAMLEENVSIDGVVDIIVDNAAELLQKYKASQVNPNEPIVKV